MSCLGEAVCLLYAEGELAGAALREAEAHLVACRDCRARVVALGEESALLREALRGEAAPRAVAAPAAAPTPAPGVALGVPIAIAAVTAALAVASALLESRLPGALDLLHPRRLKGVAEMAFDLVFLVRENAPGLLELAFSVGIVASVSALGSFAVSALSRRLFRGTALALLALLAAPEPARAVLVHRGEDLHVAAGERIDETVVTRGAGRVEVDGRIDGDLIAAAERITVRGEVTGSLYVFCRDLDLTGTVGGALHAIAESSRVEGTIRGRVYVLGEDFTLTGEGRALGDLSLVVEDAVIEGAVGRDLYVSGDRLDLRGEVGRNVTSHWLDEIVLRDGSHVGGDVELRLDEPDALERAPGARVDGEVRVAESRTAHEHYLEHYRHGRFYAVHLLWFAAAFVFGLLVHGFSPLVFRGQIATGAELLRTLGLGFVVLVVAPVAMLVAALTIVGIPTAVAALFLYIVGLYTADLAVGAWIGRWLAPPRDDSLLAFGRSLAAGLAILTVVSLVPFVGPAVGFVALLLGLGLLTARVREALL